MCCSARGLEGLDLHLLCRTWHRPCLNVCWNYVHFFQIRVRYRETLVPDIQCIGRREIPEDMRVRSRLITPPILHALSTEGMSGWPPASSRHFSLGTSVLTSVRTSTDLVISMSQKRGPPSPAVPVCNHCCCSTIRVSVLFSLVVNNTDGNILRARA